MQFFFSGEGVAIQVPVKMGKSVTEKYYKDAVLKKLKKMYYQKWHPVTHLKHVQLLHDSAPAHTSAVVTFFFCKREDNSFTTLSLFTRPCSM